MFVNGFLDTISKYNMINKADSILVGLSGGADSVCLLLNLLELKKTTDITVSAIHIHHGIRGDEADRDADFCRELCEKLNVPFTLECVDALYYSKENKLSVEEAARKLRYEVFEKYSEGKKLAAAHNLPDNAETVLINMIRGTGLKGICGIPPKRDNIIRPLLFTTRNEIEDYLAECNQKYITDSTNLSLDYTRNKIRHKIIPQMLSINNSFYKTSARNKMAFEQDEDFLENCSDSAYSSALCVGGIKTEVLKTLHPAILSRVISRFLKENHLSLSYDQIKRVSEILDGGKINYAENVYIISEKGTLKVCHASEKLPPIREELKTGICNFYDKTVETTVITGDNFSMGEFVHKKFANYFSDYGKIQGKLVIRTRQTGDKFKLPGRNFTSSVKKLLQAEIPQDERQKLIFLEDDGGIIFIEGFGFTDRVKADENTRDFLTIKIFM